MIDWKLLPVIDFYKQLYLIRTSEQMIQKYYSEDEMKTPMHMSMGGEAIAVGVCSALKKIDQVFCTYRSHATYLAKTNDIDSFFAELYGKVTGSCRGKAGSMHICDPDLGFMGTSAIVGSIIPVAIGTAFANKILKNNKITVVFFGDGAVDEGTFWESLNVACLMKLPILFVCEDNNLAVHTEKSQRRGYNSLIDIVSKFNCNVYEESSTDVEVIYNLTNEAINDITLTEKPSFLCLEYYRYLEHVGVNQDFDAKYRSITEFGNWYKRDPVISYRTKLLSRGFRVEYIKEIEEDIYNRIENTIITAKSAPFPNIDELYKEVYA
jgi:pyruvate dehydrogenase E1 component alpha subunit